MAAEGAASGSATIRDTALLHADTLAAYLKLKLPHRRTDALRRLAKVILGIIQAESTVHRKIALNLPRVASPESKTRVVARVFHDAQLTSQDVQDVLLSLLPEGKLTFVMDRTFLGRAAPMRTLARTWHYGETPLNILVLGVALGGVVLPLIWTVLPHQGNSHTGARVLLVSKLLRVLPAKRWAVLIADRRASVLMGAALPKKEFIGEDWCNFFRWKRLRMCLRIKENTRIDDELAHDQFADLKPGEARTLFERAWVYGGWMYVVITLSPAGDRVIVISDLPVWNVLQTYQKRWGTLCSFSAMKTRGLNLEATHMTAPDRISRLFGLLCIVLAWLVRVGETEQTLHPPRRDNWNRLARSQVRVGWT